MFSSAPAPYRALPAINTERIISIYLSNLNHALQAYQEIQPQRVLSLLDPGDEFPQFPGLAPESHLRIEMHDIDAEYRGFTHPTHEHMAQVLNFGRESAGRLLVHCLVGRSRSTAAIIAIMADRQPDKIPKIVTELSKKSRTAFPNALMIALTDDLLNCGGEIVRAISTIIPSGHELEGWIHLPEVT